MATVSSASDAVEAVGDLRHMLSEDADRLERIDRYLRGDQRPPYTPREANLEYRELVDKSTTNWLGLVLSARVQVMHIDGYRSSGNTDNARPWSYWQNNGLDARQSAVHRGAMGYGVAYTLTRSAVDPLTRETTPQIRGVSPRRMVAAYADVHDDWAELALHVRSTSPSKFTVELFDDVNVWTVEGVKEQYDTGWQTQVVSVEPHGARVVPVVKFPDRPDLEGRHPGRIEPLFPLQDAINQTSFDALMTQTFASWVVRTISGMTILPEHDDQADPGATLTAEQLQAARAAKLVLSQDRMLIAEDPDTKFGTLDASPLKPFIDAEEARVQHLFALSQTPPHYKLGGMINLSAEALAAAESSFSNDVDESKKQFGESWEQTFRLAAQVDGDDEAARDMSAEVQWSDHEARSFSATVDALGKAAQMLHVPVKGLWERIPGVTDQELKRWKRFAAEDDTFGRLTELLDNQAGDDGAG